jgi:Domain of unknown function (DUF929)
MSKSPTGPSRRARTVPASKTNTRNAKTRAKTRAKTKARNNDSKPSSPAPRDRFRTRHPVLTALVPVVLVVAAIATMVVIKAAGTSNPPASASSHVATGGATGSANPAATATADPGTTTLSPQVLAALTVPTTTLDSVGSPSSVALPSRTGDNTIAKDGEGKALITYIGAEYCPFCAAERWSLAVALSRFGTFENLSGTHSSDSDEFPDTQTLSFYGSTYSSPYLDFQAVEEATNQPDGSSYQALQAPTAAQSALMAKYDTQGSIPFLDIANRYVITGSSFSPQVLQGLSRSQIATDLSNPDSAVAQAIDGAANDITAAIASVTGNQPSGVGSSATIAAIAQKLGA